jgi:hypothetical protein
VKLSGVEIHYAPFVYYYYRQGVPGALTKKPAPIIAKQKIKELEQAYRYLDAAGVEDAVEWRHLALKALKASYLAYAITGQQKVARRALALARKCGTRSRGLMSLLLSLPSPLLFASMTLRHRLLHLVGKDYRTSATS